MRGTYSSQFLDMLEVFEPSIAAQKLCLNKKTVEIINKIWRGVHKILILLRYRCLIHVTMVVHMYKGKYVNKV